MLTAVARNRKAHYTEVEVARLLAATLPLQPGKQKASCVTVCLCEIEHTHAAESPTCNSRLRPGPLAAEEQHRNPRPQHSHRE
jgi:hypothetical protein